MYRSSMKLTIIWLSLSFSLTQWVSAQDGVEEVYVSQSDCKSLVVPHFQAKYKECLSLDGGDDCNQYVDFSFYEALRSACINEGISQLKLSKKELFTLFDQALIAGSIDLDAGLDELELLDEIEPIDDQVNVYPSSEDSSSVLPSSSQKPQTEIDQNKEIPHQTNAVGSTFLYVFDSLENWFPSFILRGIKGFDSGVVTDYKNFPPVFADDTIVSNAIAAVPLTTAEGISYNIWAFFILVAAILYGIFLAILCWIIFPVCLAFFGAHGKLFNLGLGSLALFNIGNALQSFKEFAVLGKRLAQAGLAGVALLCVLLYVIYVILSMPVTNSIRFYENHVYGGVDVATHDNIKEARSFWSSNSSYKPSFSITHVDPYYNGFNKTEKRDEDGYLLSSFERLTIDMNIENNSAYPLIHGEILCHVTFISGESFSFVDYIAAKPEDIINNYGGKEIFIYDEYEHALWSPELEKIMVRAQDIDSVEDRQKQLEVRCSPLASYHKKNVFEQKNQAVKALFDKQQETLTVVNNSDDYVSHFTLECIVDDRPGPYDRLNYETNDAGQIIGEYYDVKPSYTRQEFRVDGNEGYIPPGGKRAYDFSGSRYSDSFEKRRARELSDLEITIFNESALNSLAFNFSRSSQCGVYDITKAKVDFFDKYLFHIIIFSLLACLVIFTPKTGIKTLES